MVLGVTTGAFPGTEIDTGGEIVQLTEPANILGILFAFLYPKSYPDLHEESFEIIAAVSETAAKYEVASAAYVCNELLLYVSLNFSSLFQWMTKLRIIGNFCPNTPQRFWSMQLNIIILG